MRENRLYSCASSEGWRVQWGIKKKTHQRKSRDSVARVATWRETKMLKPTDDLIFKDKCKLSGRSESEHIGGSERA